MISKTKNLKNGRTLFNSIGRSSTVQCSICVMDTYQSCFRFLSVLESFFSTCHLVENIFLYKVNYLFFGGFF